MLLICKGEQMASSFWILLGFPRADHDVYGMKHDGSIYLNELTDASTSPEWLHPT